MKVKHSTWRFVPFLIGKKKEYAVNEAFLLTNLGLQLVVIRKTSVSRLANERVSALSHSCTYKNV